MSTTVSDQKLLTRDELIRRVLLERLFDTLRDYLPTGDKPVHVRMNPRTINTLLKAEESNKPVYGVYAESPEPLGDGDEIAVETPYARAVLHADREASLRCMQDVTEQKS